MTLLSVFALPAFAADEIPNPIIESVARDVAENVSAEIIKQDISSEKLDIAATTVATDAVETYVAKSRKNCSKILYSVAIVPYILC